VDERNQPEDKSRTQQKREYRELKELGIQLVDLSKGQLQNLPVSEQTREALLAAKGMTRGALQRQIRHLASLLVEEDVTAVRDALAMTSQPHAHQVAALHEAERWRDRLLSDDKIQMTDLVERYPECDLSHLRQLVRNGKKERERNKPPKSARLLFRYLMKLSKPQNGD